MGIIKDKMKFEATKEQTNPTNRIGKIKKEINQFDIDKETIKKQQNKK